MAEWKFSLQTTAVWWNYSQILWVLLFLLDNQAEKPWKDKLFLQDAGCCKTSDHHPWNKERRVFVFVLNIFRDFEGAPEIKIIMATQNSKKGLEKLEKSPQWENKKTKEWEKRRTEGGWGYRTGVHRRKRSAWLPAQWTTHGPHLGTATVTSANTRNSPAEFTQSRTQVTIKGMALGTLTATLTLEVSWTASSKLCRKMISNPGFHTQPKDH